MEDRFSGPSRQSCGQEAKDPFCGSPASSSKQRSWEGVGSCGMETVVLESQRFPRHLCRETVTWCQNSEVACPFNSAVNGSSTWQREARIWTLVVAQVLNKSMDGRMDKWIDGWVDK